jgi:probable HAF family extracellular repeat protein
MRTAQLAVPALIACLAAPCVAMAAEASFQSLGRFWAAGVSDDGNTVIGTGNDAAAGGGQVIVRWTRATGVQTLAWDPTSEHTNAIAVSGDGSTVIATDYNADALIWTTGGGLRRLFADQQPGLGGYPRAVSRDGSSITGSITGGPAFLWTAGSGGAALPLPAGRVDASGTALSDDGSVVFGMAFDNPGQRRAFRWTAAGGSTLLDHPAGLVGSEPLAASADGATAVGWAYGADDVHRPFRWTAETGVQLLTGPGGSPTAGEAADVSGDGSVVVGSAGGAFIWDEANGVRSLKAVLASEYGLDLPGWTLTSASAITPDGLAIVGQASHPEFGDNVVYRVVLPEPAGTAVLAGAAAAALLRRRNRAAVSAEV